MNRLSEHASPYGDRYLFVLAVDLIIVSLEVWENESPILSIIIDKYTKSPIKIEYDHVTPLLSD